MTFYGGCFFISLSDLKDKGKVLTMAVINS